MVTTRFIGRSGNSLFQVAACIGYAKKYNHPWGVPVDARDSAIHKIFPNLPKCRTNPNPWPRRGLGYEAASYDYSPIPNKGPNILLAGFFQSYKYFEHCENDIREVFKLDYYPEYKDYVSIHVRRGDYVNLKDNFDPVTMDYLNQAIAMFPDKKFIVCSDGIDWCKENILGTQFEFSEGKTEREDMSILHSCGNHIISNSTFSWWTAWLSPHEDKKVVCPHNLSWYGKNNGVVVAAKAKGTEPAKDLIPENWIKIKFR